jgi:hypothetical protein
MSGFIFGPTGSPVNRLSWTKPFSSFPGGRLRSIVPHRRVADIAQLPAVQPARADARLIHEIVESVMGSQEGLDPRPRLGIARTFAIQNRGAVRKVVTVGSFQENGLYAHWVERHALLLRSGTTSRFHFSKRRLRPWLSKKIKKRKNVIVVGRKGKRERSRKSTGVIDFRFISMKDFSS